MANYDDLISKIESLTVVELAELVKTLEEKFGISAAAPVAAGAGAGVAAAYSLRVLRLIWSGDRTTPAHADARGGEWSVLAVLMAAVLVLGVAPGLVLNSTYKVAAAITMEVPR